MPIHMRLPKLKGFKNKFKVVFQVVNLDRLAELFPNGGAGRPGRAGRGRRGPQGPAGQGARRPASSAGSKLQVSAHAFSASAKEKIAAAGGSGHRAVSQRNTFMAPAGQFSRATWTWRPATPGVCAG